MKKVSLALLVFMFGFAPQAPASTGHDATMQARIEEAIKTKEPKCKLKMKRVTRQGSYAYYSWRCQAVTVSLLISSHSSIELASAFFDRLPDIFEENGLKMKITRRNVDADLADEHYFWAEEGNGRVTGVDFRSKCVVVHVGSGSSETAYRFARHLFEVIKLKPANVIAPHDLEK